MADTKISALAELTIPEDGDFIPIVDTSETATKKISVENLRHSQINDYITQSDNTDQAIADIKVAQRITFDTDIDNSGFTRTSSSRFTCATTGDYLIAFSGVAVGAQNEYISVWLRKGTGAGASTVADNIPNSNTLYQFKTNGMSSVIAVTFILDIVAGEWIEWLTWGSAVTSTWNHTAAVVDNPGVTPGRPACPSIIFTCNRV